MITAIWCENSALIVGMPRRSTEWSTESSWTSVARWISSTTAASVTARGCSAPEARALKSSSVGRNCLPRMRSRCSLASVMRGKSALTMRRSSPATWSSAAATGSWMSWSDARVTCGPMLLGLGQGFDPLAHVHEPDVHGEGPAVQLAGLARLALLLQRAAQPIQDAQPLLVVLRRQLDAAAQNRFRHRVRLLFEAAGPQRLRGAQLPFRRAQRLLEFGDRFVQQAHLLERDAQRSEEHTSELQSPDHLVCRLLLEKKNTARA